MLPFDGRYLRRSLHRRRVTVAAAAVLGLAFALLVASATSQPSQTSEGKKASLSRAKHVRPAQRRSARFWRAWRTAGADYAFTYRRVSDMKKGADLVLVGRVVDAALDKVKTGRQQIKPDPSGPAFAIETSTAKLSLLVSRVIKGDAALAGSKVAVNQIVFGAVTRTQALKIIRASRVNLPTGETLAFLKRGEATSDGAPGYFFVNDQAVWASTTRLAVDRVLDADLNSGDPDYLSQLGRPRDFPGLVHAVASLS